MSLSIQETHQKLVNKDISCQALVQEKINQLKENSHNSSNFILEDLALEMAKKVDEKLNKGEKIGLLEGIPFGVKDVYLVEGCPASASSDMLKPYISPYTATAIQKLINAGAIPIAKENCDAYGHGSTNENSIFGAVKNAINPELVAGGSSGGSAVNVAKNYTFFSIGGDTGGSIRQPAGYNKVYGLKPTYGKISRYGVMAYASSTDCVGPITNNLEDMITVFNTMKGKDYHDQTTFDSPEIKMEDIKSPINPAQFPIGYYTNFIDNPALNPKIKDDFLKLISDLKNAGFPVIPLDFYDVDTLVATYYILAMAETASNLSRLDGTNYGMRSKEKALKTGYAETRSENFSEETKRRIVGGNQVLSHGYSDDIYMKARVLRTEIMHHFTNDFQKVKVILSPVTPNLPPKIGDNLKDPMAMYLSDAYTVGFSLGGLPTLTVPFGTETGMQITADKNNEESLFQLANYLKESTK